MIDSLIVTIVMCIDTCNLSPVQHSIHSAFRELNIKEAVIRAVEDTRQREQKAGKPYWHVRNYSFVNSKFRKHYEEINQ